MQSNSFESPLRLRRKVRKAADRSWGWLSTRLSSSSDDLETISPKQEVQPIKPLSLKPTKLKKKQVQSKELLNHHNVNALRSYTRRKTFNVRSFDLKLTRPSTISSALSSRGFFSPSAGNQVISVSPSRSGLGVRILCL
tara:strand:+ start:330 stop:746 length:417 start_codon:yes stop_codon:yes gene_type:complete